MLTMVGLLITTGVVSWLILNQMFSKKAPPKSVEDQLGEAIGKYLKEGIKVKMETLDSGRK